MASKKPLAPAVRELAEAKLASSGLTLDDAKMLKIDSLNGVETQAANPRGPAVVSLRFNYLDPLTRKPLLDHGRNFFRLRYLEKPLTFDNVTEKKIPRYVQPEHTLPMVYYPANQEWGEFLKNPGLPLILTEGELKAAKACKEGCPTIAIGGVWSWRAVKRGVLWLPTFDFIAWPERVVNLCFDSDYQTNPEVCQALHALAHELERRGAYAHLITLPSLADFEKTGLDDYLTFGGPTALADFQKMLHDAEPLGLSEPLWVLNKKYIYVQDPGLIINEETTAKTSPAAFKDHLEAPAEYLERVFKPDGTVTRRPASAAATWIKWPLRRAVWKLTYQPGQDQFVDGPQFNIWPGWGCNPVKGDVQPWLALIDHLFTGAEPAAKKWFLRWCAYPLRYPGLKMFSSAVVHGIRHGTGKSLVGFTLGKIYGKNFTEISQMNLHSAFNEWAEGKQFVMGDDVTGSTQRQDADLLKKMITQNELRINTKYIPSYTVPDCVNYYFTANHPDSFFLEDDDRRFFIHEVLVVPLDEAFYAEYDLWLNSTGPAAVFDWLLKLDLGDFNPAAPAFRTMARERMITGMQSDLATWVRGLIATPEVILKLGDIAIEKDLFSSKELLQLYDPTNRTNVTANGVARELARAGIRQALGGKPVRLADGQQMRLFIIRRPEVWISASFGEITEHLNAWSKQQAARQMVKYCKE